MIKGFAHKGLEEFYLHGRKRGIQPAHARRLLDILHLLDAAATVEDMAFPGARLHEWSGQGRGTWSVDVSGPWRLTFRFEDGHALDVDYVQPH